MKNTILFFDSGDTIIDEGTEVRLVPDGVVQTAECIPGAVETLQALHAAGYRLALVADGLNESFERMFRQHGIRNLFSAWVTSESTGHAKPHPSMFQTAMDELKLTDADKPHIIMIGNNVERDITGANRFGIRSVLLTWSPRYRMTPKNEEETPIFRAAEPSALLPLIEAIENGQA